MSAVKLFVYSVEPEQIGFARCSKVHLFLVKFSLCGGIDPVEWCLHCILYVKVHILEVRV